jgi:hypothetical protein
MRALKTFRYAKASHKKGDMLEVKSRHVLVLTHAGLAQVVEVGPQAQVYHTREMEAKKPVDMTVLELREEADKRGIYLPRGYLAKAVLLDIVERGYK